MRGPLLIPAMGLTLLLGGCATLKQSLAGEEDITAQTTNYACGDAGNLGVRYDDLGATIIDGERNIRLDLSDGGRGGVYTNRSGDRLQRNRAQIIWYDAQARGSRTVTCQAVRPQRPATPADCEQNRR